MRKSRDVVLTAEAQDTVEWLRIKFGFEPTPFERAQLTMLARIARALESAKGGLEQ